MRARLLISASEGKGGSLASDRLHKPLPKWKSVLLRIFSRFNLLVICFLLFVLLIANVFHLVPVGAYFNSCNANLGRKLNAFFSSQAPSNSSSPPDLDLQAPAPPGKIRALAFVGIMSCHKNGGRRTAVRNTWLPKQNESVSGAPTSNTSSENRLIFKFVIGKSANATEDEPINREMELYGDVLRLDHVEDYKYLNKKSFAYFKLAFSLYDADYYVKMDDDIYLIPVRLASFLVKKRETQNIYWGCMVKGPVLSDPTTRWYEPNHLLLPYEYPFHAVGPFYGISKPVVETLIRDPTIERRMFFSEDAMIGFWMLLWDVKFEDDWNLCSHSCTNYTVAVWHVWSWCPGLCNPEWAIPALHRNPNCRPTI